MDTNISPVVKSPGREADHTRLTGAEVKKAWLYTSMSTLKSVEQAMTLCSHVDGYQFFRKVHCQHLQGGGRLNIEADVMLAFTYKSAWCHYLEDHS
jgi:hypothetical protein